MQPEPSMTLCQISQIVKVGHECERLAPEFPNLEVCVVSCSEHTMQELNPTRLDVGDTMTHWYFCVLTE